MHSLNLNNSNGVIYGKEGDNITIICFTKTTPPPYEADSTIWLTELKPLATKIVRILRYQFIRIYYQF